MSGEVTIERLGFHNHKMKLILKQKKGCIYLQNLGKSNSNFPNADLIPRVWFFNSWFPTSLFMYKYISKISKFKVNQKIFLYPNCSIS